MATQLLLDDGIVSSQSRFEPNNLYYPDEATNDAIRFFFSSLESCCSVEHSGAKALEIERLPFSADLAALVQDGSQKTLSVDDITNGMRRIATHFILHHELIQARANAYVRVKLAGCELVVEGQVSSQGEGALDRDQLLLNSFTVPPSPRRLASKGSTNTLNSLEDLGGAVVPPPPTALFRSDSLRQEQLDACAPSAFALEDASLCAVLTCLPSVFGGQTFLSRREVTEHDAGRLQWLWEFFDHDQDGLLTRDDLLLGWSHMAEHFIAADEFTQLLVNAYIQKKIRRAIFAISRALDREVQAANPSNRETPDLPKGSRVVFTDEEGNLHDARVLRKSQLPMEGRDAYYIETKGVKIHSPLRRMRPFSDQDRALFDGDSKELGAAEDYRVVSELSAVGDDLGGTGPGDKGARKGGIL
eukprot:CAMPEP_0173309312 /NCGR_PEP_ID=MMETSP1143-20121109/22258_1 /TAXON_ID=483371 /ORGANISM="non described non described, Strain CCMP2298" /LENGTH=415 /DNA_ID=CAMNT_0014250885 /DNA_START=52 /DNA_END=1295 /DNA_ORIENTATION=-